MNFLKYVLKSYGKSVNKAPDTLSRSWSDNKRSRNNLIIIIIDLILIFILYVIPYVKALFLNSYSDLLIVFTIAYKQKKFHECSIMTFEIHLNLSQNTVIKLIAIILLYLGNKIRLNCSFHGLPYVIHYLFFWLT